MKEKNKTIKLSIIIPVFNRPYEVQELLESLQQQTNREFEVIIVEDGSTVKCNSVIENFKQNLDIKYFFKPNSGPGQSRNYGYEKAMGNYYIFLDSDCILPPDYIQTVQTSLKNKYTDAFGGPDKAHEKFTLLQKGINYSMTSFLTTGGIRGQNEKLGKFHPRSFNMGCSQEVLKTTNGFSKMRFGEDIDMSIRILKNGFKTQLIPEAFVYHKRRSNLKQFFKQIFNSGIARINLSKIHPNSLSLIHMVPTFFSIGIIWSIFFSLIYSSFFLIPILTYSLILFLDSLFKNKSLSIAALSILTSYTQIFAYGFGFLWAILMFKILNKNEYSAFNASFYE